MNTSATIAATVRPTLPPAHSRMLLDCIKDFYSNPANRAEFERWKEDRHNQPTAPGLVHKN